jgi:hypothetical protein
MNEARIYILYLCVFHRSMALRRERAALAHMPRMSASSAPARDRTHMQEHTRVPIYTPGLCIAKCMHILYLRCALAIHTGGHTRAHDVAGRIVGARNRTHAHMDTMQPRARSQPNHRTSTHLSIDIGPVYRYV